MMLSSVLSVAKGLLVGMSEGFSHVCGNCYTIHTICTSQEMKPAQTLDTTNTLPTHSGILCTHEVG